METIISLLKNISLSDWISLFSLIIAIISLFCSWMIRNKLDKQQIDINSHILSNYEKENNDKKKAFIEGEIIKEKDKSILRIHNKGQTQADNVNFKIVDTDILFTNNCSPYQISPGNKVDIYYRDTSFVQKASSVIFTWSDQDNDNQKREQKIIF